MAILQNLALFSLFLLAKGAPTDPDIALARKYAPQWRFHTSEAYWPSTVDYFLAGVKLYDDSGKAIANQPALTSSNLADAAAAAGTSPLYLTVDIDSNKAGFLQGQNPSTSSPNVNTFIVEKSNGIVDIYYWLFTPFNLAKSVPLVGEVGDHVGDWERMTVRTVNGVATEVDYHAHSDTGSGTVPWDEAPKFDSDSRPVGYVAQGSHGFWSSAGTFTYVNAVIFKLQDETSDNGVYWDTKDSLLPLAYPDSYTGNLNWLTYTGAWGNKGDDSCWWHIFYDECEVVTGPTGPLRSDVLSSADAKVSTLLKTTATSSPFKERMRGALSHTLGTVSTEATSSYTVRIDSEVRTAAAETSYTDLAVQQTCTVTTGNATTTTTTVAKTSLSQASDTFTLTPDACTADSIVSSYLIGLCEDVSCTFTSTSRKLRAYSADRSIKGVQNATAIIVNDLVDWSL